MNTLIRLNPLNDEIDTFFDSTFNPVFRGINSFAIDMRETNSAYQIEAALPGMKPDDIYIKVQHNILTINAETNHEDKNRDSYQRFYSSYHRSIRLPDSVNGDQTEAWYENGILKLTLPKAPSQHTRQIPIRVKTSRQQPVFDAWLDPLKQRVEKLIAPLRKAS